MDELKGAENTDEVKKKNKIKKLCFIRKNSGATHLDDSFHHVHHLVYDGDDFVRPLRRRHVGPVRGRQHVAAGHVQDVRGRQLEVDRGAVGVVDDGRQEGVFSWSRHRHF